MPTVLILAAGPGIGASCVHHFGLAGYNVAAASRSRETKLKDEKHLELHLDLSKPETVPKAFETVRTYFGHPDVVIYNGAAVTLASAENPLGSLSQEVVEHDMAVNITSALIAAREAIRGWTSHAGMNEKTFIYTGNKQNVMADPKALTFGMAKTAAAKMIWDCATAYANQSVRFYFTDQRKADGSPAREAMDPDARAASYVFLADARTPQKPWHYTFVKGVGYVDFRGVDQAWDIDL